MAEHATLRNATASKVSQALDEIFRKYGQVDAEKIPWQQLDYEVQAVIQRETAAAFALLFMATVEDDPGLGLLLPSANIQSEAAGLAYGAQAGRLVSAPLIRNLQDATARGRGLPDVLSTARAEGIAITEVTKTVSAAEQSAYGLGRQAAGLSGDPDGRWMIERGACPFCVELAGTLRAVWQIVNGGPPPAHPHCQCWIDWVPIAVTP